MSQKKREVRREEKSEEKRNLKPKMSDDYLDDEGSVKHEADFVNTIGDMEVELRLPLENDLEQDRLREDIRTHSRAVALSAVDQEEQRWFEPPNGARPKWARHGLPLPIIMEPCSPVTGATANLVGPGAVLRRLGAAAPTYPELTQRRRNAGIKTSTWVELERESGFPGPGGQLPREETQFEHDPYKDALPSQIDRIVVTCGCGPEMEGRSRFGPPTLSWWTRWRVYSWIWTKSGLGHPSQVAFTVTKFAGGDQLGTVPTSVWSHCAIKWMGWVISVVGWKTRWWQQLPLCNFRRISWRLCFDGCFLVQWCRHHLRSPCLRLWNSCYNACSRGSLPRPRWLHWEFWHRVVRQSIVRPGVWTWMKHSCLCCWDGKQRRCEVIMLWYPHGDWSGEGGQQPGSVLELNARTWVVVRRSLWPPGIWPAGGLTYLTAGTRATGGGRGVCDVSRCNPEAEGSDPVHRFG